LAFTQAAVSADTFSIFALSAVVLRVTLLTRQLEGDGCVSPDDIVRSWMSRFASDAYEDEGKGEGDIDDDADGG
jgi:hypothetical protein